MTHVCTRCGADKPLESFKKHRFLAAGKTWAKAQAWYCDDCIRAYGREWNAKHPGYSSDAVRRYRQDPEKRERDRAASRRWKEANRERNRARDRERDRARRRALVTSGSADKTPGNQSDPATAATARGHGNQEGPS